MSEKQDAPAVPEVVREAARALVEPDDADLDVLSAVNKGLRAVSPGRSTSLPWQRPPAAGEEALAARRPA